MNNKIIMFFVVLLISIGMVWAENNTAENLKTEDNVNYILPISISDGEIKFNDGFTGFNIDADKKPNEFSDKFILSEFSGDNVENTVKLLIIESYKQGKENEIAHLITELNKGDSNDDVIKKALSSNDKVGKNPIVKINDSKEAIFTFEYLKSVDSAKSDCIAYKVSLKTVEEPEILTSPNDDLNDSQRQETNHTTDNISENQKESSKEESAQKQNEQNDTNNLNQKDENAADNQNKSKKEFNETNKTIINKTSTSTVNETNTTIINTNNVKTINKTSNTPENDTVSTLLKTVGNPIFLLIIVIIIITIVAVIVRRKY